jgi:hypothetical protein
MWRHVMWLIVTNVSEKPFLQEEGAQLENFAYKRNF